VAAAVGAVAVLLGGWVDRRWQRRSRREDRFEAVLASLLSETLTTLFEPGLWADRNIRRMAKVSWTMWTYPRELLSQLRRAVGEIASAESQIRLLAPEKALLASAILPPPWS